MQDSEHRECWMSSDVFPGVENNTYSSVSERCSPHSVCSWSAYKAKGLISSHGPSCINSSQILMESTLRCKIKPKTQSPQNSFPLYIGLCRPSPTSVWASAQGTPRRSNTSVTRALHGHGSRFRGHPPFHRQLLSTGCCCSPGGP